MNFIWCSFINGLLILNRQWNQRLVVVVIVLVQMCSVMGFFFSFLSWCFLLLGGGEVPALCQQSNGAHGDMWWYTSPGICLFYCSFLDDFMLLINSWILWMKSIFYLFNIPSLSECRWMKLSTSLMSYSCSTKLLLQRLRLFMMLVTDWCDFFFFYSLLNTYSRMNFGLVL